MLGREQFTLINQELQRLLGHIKAHFVGLVDADGNLAGAAGTLEEYDLVLLTRALSIDHTATSTLASILEEASFTVRILKASITASTSSRSKSRICCRWR
jgi:hypothetical protein